MRLSKHSLSLVVSLLTATGATCQRQGPQIPRKPGVEDPGEKVEMFESPTLDRFLRTAQEEMAREEYGLAIVHLQDVIEGRTGELVDPDAVTAPEGGEGEAGREPAEGARRADAADVDNPSYSVFSSDERVYRPVTRLCHELLAAMPPEGVGLYRVKFEGVAQQGYEAAVAAADLSGLEAVSHKYFATLSAGRAMAAAIDLQMDAGRFRAAIQTLHTLLDIYPEASRQEAGLVDVLLRVKMAICFQQLGEFDLAKEHLELASQLFPEASVRLMGELYTVRDLHASPLFDLSSVADVERVPAESVVPLDQADHLVPLWEFRFTEEKPYQAVRATSTNQGRIVMMGGRGGVAKFPHYNVHEPGTTVRFLDGRVVFTDNYRILEHEQASGRQLRAFGDQKLAEPATPSKQPNTPRARIPVYDYLANRVVADQERYYNIVGWQQTANSNGLAPVLRNKLVAYDRTTGEQVWSIEPKHGKGDEDLMTFLAAPTVFRDQLLVPILDNGSYGLLALRTATGEELFRSYLHSGGTGFARAPTPPVVVSAGVAFITTNAGVLSAVDARTGVLQWSRRYERIHPFRGEVRRRNEGQRHGMGFPYQVAEAATLPGFAPADLHVVHDLVLLAPADGTVLMCINAANGEILWLHNAAEQRDVVPKSTYVVGHNSRFLFLVCGESRLMCVGIRTGLRHWLVDVPGTEGVKWSGRGCVTEKFVVMPGRPGNRNIVVVPADTPQTPRVRILDLPRFSIGKEPLSGPANLHVGEATVIVCYEGGIEAYSSAQTLETLAREAKDPARQAAFLAHCGKLEEAIDVLLGTLDTGELDGERRQALSIRLLALAEEVSLLLATDGKRQAALALLDRCEQRVQHPSLVRRLHLLRLQVYRTLGDLAGIDREQEFIERGDVK